MTIKTETSRGPAPGHEDTSKHDETRTKRLQTQERHETDLFRLEQSLRVRKYQEAERTRAVQVVAHELRKAVTLILMELELMRRKTRNGPKDSGGRLDIMERGAGNAGPLIGGLTRTSVGDQPVRSALRTRGPSTQGMSG